MLELNPRQRISAEDALAHAYFSNLTTSAPNQNEFLTTSFSENLKEYLLERLQKQKNKERVNFNSPKSSGIDSDFAMKSQIINGNINTIICTNDAMGSLAALVQTPNAQRTSKFSKQANTQDEDSGSDSFSSRMRSDSLNQRRGSESATHSTSLPLSRMKSDLLRSSNFYKFALLNQKSGVGQKGCFSPPHSPSDSGRDHRRDHAASNNCSDDDYEDSDDTDEYENLETTSTTDSRMRTYSSFCKTSILKSGTSVSRGLAQKSSLQSTMSAGQVQLIRGDLHHHHRTKSIDNAVRNQLKKLIQWSFLILNFCKRPKQSSISLHIDLSHMLSSFSSPLLFNLILISFLTFLGVYFISLVEIMFMSMYIECLHFTCLLYTSPSPRDQA
eukprot:TRINITY_DN10910_c0_g1_i4.p1 TRINITY_DN10910_c0_g1~~TRINITY_DN10910_c0_g1_i4.p1  ORF type:complete len:386 (-),score=23.07 TRINITY_DN10910_c0_g1_i4:48-1205(-)